MKKIFLLASFVVAMSLNAIAQNDTVYFIDFQESIGSWSIEDKVKPEGLTFVWSQTSQYGMKATAYVGGKNNETESWLVSAPLDLTSNTTLSLDFKHARKYGDNSHLSVQITKDGTNWTKLEFANWPDGSSWNFIDAGEVDITSYISATTQIAFVYTSTSSAAATWEVDNVLVKGNGTRIVEPEKPIEHITLAEFVDKADPSTRYEVTATISKMVDNYYGNFWITDGTNEVYVYGLANGEQNRNVVDSLAIEAGDEITLSGMYLWYTNAAGESYAELMNGRFVDVKHAPVVEEVTMEYYGESADIEGGHEFFLECLRYKVVGENNVDSVLYSLNFISANKHNVEGKYTILSDSLLADYTSIQYGSDDAMYFNDGNVRLSATGNKKDTVIDGNTYVAYEHVVDIYLKQHIYHEEIADSIVDTNYETKVLTLPLIAIGEDEVVVFDGSTTSVENVKTPIINDNKRYNLIGTIVDEQYKGVVILNGKKYIQ